MRYIKLSFKYLIKNGLFLFLLSVVPAVFIGTLLSPFKFLEFINNYSGLTVVGFADIFYGVIDISWLKILFYIIGFALLGVCVSVILGEIDGHFRSGKHNYSNFKNHINNNVLVVALNIIAVFIINFILSILAGTIIYIFHIVIAGLNATPNAWCVIIAIIIYTLFFCISNIISFILYLNIPKMLLNGYTLKQTLSSTINSLSNNFISLILGYLVPNLIIIPLVAIFSFSGVAMSFVNIIGVIILIMYNTSYIMVSYYDINNISRYDNRKYYSIK